MHFQWAAWPLQYLRDQMGSARYGTGDFESTYLTFYLNILLVNILAILFIIHFLLGTSPRMYAGEVND